MTVLTSPSACVKGVTFSQSKEGLVLDGGIGSGRHTAASGDRERYEWIIVCQAQAGHKHQLFTHMASYRES
jgi:hypothetical protein